ncbi:malonate decarboxylase holo-ACP synthase [uncultured Pseudomonas sp.]|uniref:malonate decarboxylase holo-ACP synthase n=1 Tax=uncultured Pseudomonas sp. TaxID=114707 RepID=UPI0025F1914F|nr:malonate decarboxylase holo-ACP synthase [uncultured Pseudomonas sp.]
MHGPLPHDLLWGMPRLDAAPAWVHAVLEQGQPVVVRREALAADLVAVGIRGPRRDQRYAAGLPRAAIRRRVSPEQLASVEAEGDWPALQALRQLRPLFDALGLVWGVGGSAGYQLATGLTVLHQGSDLDLILRTPQHLSRGWAAELVAELERAACRVDVQLQLPAGGLALREWAGTARQVMLKTDHGARLVSNPWQPLEACA